jgi:hypothetical protein
MKMGLAAPEPGEHIGALVQRPYLWVEKAALRRRMRRK